MKTRILIGPILVFALGLTAVGQRGGRGGVPDPVIETQQALKLSSAQVEKLRALLDTRVQSEQSAQDDIQAKIDALVELQEKPSPNSAQVAKASQALRDAEQTRRAGNDKFRSDFLGLLTEEQKKNFDSINAAAVSADALTRLGVIDGGRGRGGRGPGPGFGPGPGRGFPPPPPLRQPPPPPRPGDLDPQRVVLGKQLFSNTRLSNDGTVSCASCHDPERAFSDGRAVARGVHNIEGTRNSPSLVNVGFSRSFFWDGRALTLEHQVLGPVTNPKELGLTEAELERRTGMKSKDVAVALASYIRTIRSFGSRFDSFNSGQPDALDGLEQAGLEIFRGKGQCAGCHAGPNLTDDNFHNTGVSWRNGRFQDEGRFVVSQDSRDHGSFKTPTLREVERTGPYMHDGSVATLEDVVQFYSDGGHRNPYLDHASGRLDSPPERRRPWSPS